MSDLLRPMKMERINIYIAKYMEEEESLTFMRGVTTYRLLGINLLDGEAYIEVGEGIGLLEPALEDVEVDILYTEILRRMHGARN